MSPRWVVLGLLAAGCNRYDLLYVEEFVLPPWPPEVDVVVVMDRSESMRTEMEVLGPELVSWTQRLAEQRAALSGQGLEGAVGGYVGSLKDPVAYADIQFGVVDSAAHIHRGALVGETPLVSLDDPEFATLLQENLLCGGCYGELADAPDYQCGDPLGGVLSTQFLDCLCEPEGWGGTCQDDDEQPLEAVMLASCRSLDAMAEPCEESPLGFTEAELGLNAGLIRTDSVVVPVVFTDEGDSSTRTPQQDAIPDAFERGFRTLDQRMVWAVMGPVLDQEFLPVCGAPATGWGTLRLDWMVERTGGLKLPIHGEECDPSTLRGGFDRLTDLIGGRAAAFPLSRPADPARLFVTVAGRPIARAKDRRVDAFGFPDFGDGWTYADDPPTVTLHGEAIPDTFEPVVITYDGG